jgi:hypothetical protein
MRSRFRRRTVMSRYDVIRCMSLIFMLILGGCATEPPIPTIPTDPGVIIPRSPALTFDAALNALKAEGINDIFQQKKPLYIHAASPLNKMTSGDTGHQLYGRNVLVNIWFEPQGTDSTRVVIKGYLFTSGEVIETILSKMRSLLGIQ